ncbi:MAG TPA: T9SS type A sorting domain-containing protein [Candidatus Kapabacteria bacterium]|nr:T9SS type A sorting domain-containing protein [Candidatus Kapabacteria bacterium]
MKIFLSCTILLCLAVAAHVKAQPVEEGRTAATSPRGVESTGPYLVLTLPGHRDWVQSVAFDETGTRLVSTSSDSSVRTWNAVTGDSLLVMHGHRVTTLTASFSSDGAYVVSGSMDHTARIWSATDGHLISTLVPHYDWVVTARYVHHDSLVFTASSGYIRLWHPLSGDRIDSVHNDVPVLDLTPDGKLVFGASGGGYGALIRFDTDSTIERFDGVILGEFNHAGTQICMAMKDTSIVVWDIASRSIVARFKGHLGEVYSVSFDRAGRRVVSASADRTVRVWDIATGAQVFYAVAHDGAAICARFNPQGDRVASGGKDRAIRIWDVSASGVDAPVAGVRSEGVGVECLPNVTSGPFVVRLHGAGSGVAHVEVIDLLGNVVRSSEASAASGWVNVWMDASSLASGLYVVRVRIGGGMATSRLLVR